MIVAVLLSTLSMCHAGLYADKHCTPGATFAGVTRAQVCTSGWSAKHRNVTTTERHNVFAAYGIPYSQHLKYELDHLISLEVGGSNVEKNLWPEPLAAAHKKDAVENQAHADLCAGKITLKAAQARLRAYSR